MLTALALALFALLPTRLQDGGPPADPERVEQTLERLEDALERGEPADRIAAIREASRVVEPKVIEAIGKGVRDDAREVRLAAFAALGSMPHADALETLAKIYKRDRDLRDVPEIYEALVLAIAQHGKARSVGLLTDFSLRRLDAPVLRARILGLARIRDRAALAGLFAMMAKLGDGELPPYMADFRTALTVLAGADHGGESRAAWRRWWEQNGRGFEVAPEPAALPPELDAAWTNYWEHPSRGSRPGAR